MFSKKYNHEGTNMKYARRYLESLGYNPEQRQSLLDNIRRDIPNSRLNKCKFLLGVTRLCVTKQLQSATDIMNLNTALKYINSPEHVGEYDHNLNDESLTTLHNRFKSFAEQDLETSKKQSALMSYTINEDYTIVPIDSYKQASEYSQYTTWCVTYGEQAFNSYTADGSGRFYFCLRKDFETVPKVKGDNAPLDSYGLSMIAVSVNMFGVVNTITCRWNHDMGGNDTVMSIEDLEKLLGRRFYDTFKPYSKDELKAKGKYISDVIGSYYEGNGIKGIVAAVDADERPILILPLDWSDKKMTWEEAMEYGRSLPSPWHIPSKEELEKIWFIEGWPSVITKIINRGMEAHGGKELPIECFSSFWSSSGYLSSYAFCVGTEDGSIRYIYKSHLILVCPVASLKRWTLGTNDIEYNICVRRKERFKSVGYQVD